LIGFVWFASRARAGQGAGRVGGAMRSTMMARSMMMAVAISIFMAATEFLFKSLDPLAYLVFPALVTGLVYALAGLLAGLPRFAWIGCGIFALSLIGYLATPAWTAFWIAAAGGGGLILGGLWLRKV
jgi:hypothetical protein